MTMYRAIIIVALGVLASVLPSGPSFVSAQTEGVMPFPSAGFQSGVIDEVQGSTIRIDGCLLYTSPSPRDRTRSRMPSSA